MVDVIGPDGISQIECTEEKRRRPRTEPWGKSCVSRPGERIYKRLSRSCQGSKRTRRASLELAGKSFPKKLWVASKGHSARLNWQAFIGFGHWRVIDDFATSSFQE